MPTLTSLPPEILRQIFCKLSQKQCVECMRVCPYFRREIPGYTTAIWKRFEMSEYAESDNAWRSLNKLMVKCLGPHVVDVSLGEVDTAPTLHLLARLSCAIETLEIISGSGGTALVKSIQLFSSTLSQLEITYCPRDISITNLLRLLPNLTHLTMLTHFEVQLKDTRRMVENFPPSKLVYLHLDLAFPFESRIVPILRQSPELKTFILSTVHPGKPEEYEIEYFIDVDRIFTLCPQIFNFMWYQTIAFDEDQWRLCKKWKELSETADPECQNGALRKLKFYGDSGDLEHQLLPILTRSEHTLETMELSYLYEDGCPALVNTSLPNLKNLELTYHGLTAREWTTLFSEKWSNVETVIVNMRTVDLEWDGVVQGISTLANLRYLRLEDHFDRHCYEHTANCESLHMLSRNSRLEILQLKDICLPDHVLLSLSNIRSLKDLDITIDNHQNCLSLEGIDRFLTALIDANFKIPKIFFQAFDRHLNLAFWEHKYFKPTDSQVSEPHR